MKTLEPEVNIINWTQDALELLIYTKSGRLSTGTTLCEIKAWPVKIKLDHLGYMFDTIMTSFEFVDYVFEIKNVSRALTHQLVRTRTASYQQQAMRVVDARDASVLVTSDHPAYERAINAAFESYAEMVDDGVPVQDSRGVLPTAVHTTIVVKANLRTLSGMAELRLCKRAEGEYQKVFKLVVGEILKIHPWAGPLLKVFCVKYATCAFPRYVDCPVQHHTVDVAAWATDIEKAWENCNHVANPVANKNGMTM